MSSDSELIIERWSGLNEIPSDTEHLQERRDGGERNCKETEKEGQVRDERSRREMKEESKVAEKETESRCGQTCRNGDLELGEGRETESRREDIEMTKEVDKDVERERVRNTREEDVKERERRGSEDMPHVERSIQVLDGHIALGSVQWKECRAKAAGRVQV